MIEPPFELDIKASTKSKEANKPTISNTKDKAKNDNDSCKIEILVQTLALPDCLTLSYFCCHQKAMVDEDFQTEQEILSSIVKA